MLKCFVLFFLLCVPGRAWAEIACDTDSAIPIEVHPVFENPRYDFTASLSDIQKMESDVKHDIQEAITLGVTRYEPMVEFHTPVEVVTFPDGRTCTRVKSANVTIGYKNVVVYIAREIPQNNCGFNEVMAHEQKHINVNRLLLQENVPRFQQRLDDYLTTYGAFAGEKNDGKLAAMQDDLQEKLNMWSREMLEENVARQKEVDSPAEYTRLSNVCNGQLSLIAGQALIAHGQ